MAIVSLTIKGWRGIQRPAKVLPRVVEKFVAAWSMKFLEGARNSVPRGVKRIHPKGKRAKGGGSASLSKSMQRLAFVPQGLRSYAIVGPTARHARWFVGGTSPHPIEARRAKWLTIWKPNAPDADEYGFIFRKKVYHPGTKPHDWQTLATTLVRPWEQQLWSRAMRAAAGVAT